MTFPTTTHLPFHFIHATSTSVKVLSVQAVPTFSTAVGWQASYSAVEKVYWLQVFKVSHPKECWPYNNVQSYLPIGSKFFSMCTLWLAANYSTKIIVLTCCADQDSHGKWNHVFFFMPGYAHFTFNVILFSNYKYSETCLKRPPWWKTTNGTAPLYLFVKTSTQYGSKSTTVI